MTEVRAWISLSEAAERFGVSIHTMRELLRESETPVLHLNKRVRIQTADLEQLFKDRFTTIGE